MNADIDPFLDVLTKRIIGAAFTVARALGHGFLEIVYRNALKEEFSVLGLRCAVEEPFCIHYREKVIGKYVADLVVENSVVVELKAVASLSKSHSAQVFNYLKASNLPVGMLFNFGTQSLEFRRVLYKKALEIR